MIEDSVAVILVSDKQVGSGSNKSVYRRMAPSSAARLRRFRRRGDRITISVNRRGIADRRQ